MLLNVEQAPEGADDVQLDVPNDAHQDATMSIG